MPIHVIKVPDVGEGIAEVELVAWHVAPGDTVAEDQPLADVMTDKANVEIPSPVAGLVLALGGDVGQMLAVGSELIRIDKGGAEAAASAAAAPAVAVTAAAAEAAQRHPVSVPADSHAPAPTPARAPATPLVARRAPAASSAPATDRARPIASPAVRRRAWELGIELADVAPSGTAGRIVHADLDAALRRGVRRAPAASAASAASAALPTAVTALPTDEVETVPVIGLRRRIAIQMQEAKRRVPHFSYVEELDVSALEDLRAALNERWSATRGHLTLLPFLMRAVVLAVREHPQINARFDDEAGTLARHRAVHLGIATQTRHGLLVPVVRHAAAMDAWSLAADVARLAEAARAGRATRAELSGSTITISSLGALGGIVSTPVINRPEVAIVGVNRIVEKPVVRGGSVVVRQTMNLSSSFDHRVVDGADAARFIQSVRALIETPALLFVG